MEQLQRYRLGLWPGSVSARPEAHRAVLRSAAADQMVVNPRDIGCGGMGNTETKRRLR